MISSDNSLDLESTDGPSSFDTSSFEDIVYSSPDIVSSKGPSKSLLKWYDDLTDEDIEELMFSKSGVGLANGKTQDAILNKTFGVIRGGS
ncbi:hypothetical protein Tco_1324679 [Tanacetum coccineum]